MYILVEKIMNGTVEMQQTLTAYNMDFDDAIKNIKNNLKNLKHAKVYILKDDPLNFEFKINQEFPCYGKITAIPLHIIT